MTAKKFKTIDQYHEAIHGEARERIDLIRKTIMRVAPGLKQEISYNMPAFRQHGVVVYYAVYKQHISLFPAPSGKEWDDDFSPYKTSGKGTIQFPHTLPIPGALIERIVRHLAKEDLRRGKVR